MVERRVLHRGKFLEFRIDTVERADGSRATRDIAGHPGAVAIVALDTDDRVALVRQWRLPANAALLEIPAGGLEVDDQGVKEDPDAAARRELEEETGLRAETWRKLGAFYTAPGFTDEFMYLYLATDLAPVSDDGRLGPDEDERLILEWRPWPEAVAAVERGEIRDAKSIVGLFWLERLRRDLPGTSDGATAADGGETITVTYRLTLGEIVRAVVGLSARSVGVRLLGFLVVALTIVPVLNGDLASIVFLVLGASLVTGWFAAPFAWWQFRKRPDLVEADTTLTLDTNGLQMETPFVNARTAWSTFRKVHDVAGFLLFDNGAGISVVIPKRAFTGSQLGVVYRLLDRSGIVPGAATR